MRTRSRIETLPRPAAARRGRRLDQHVTQKPYVLPGEGLEALLRAGQTLVVAVQLSNRG